jgi:hypothetical protein
MAQAFGTGFNWHKTGYRGAGYRRIIYDYLIKS